MCTWLFTHALMHKCTAQVCVSLCFHLPLSGLMSLFDFSEMEVDETRKQWTWGQCRCIMTNISFEIKITQHKGDDSPYEHLWQTRHRDTWMAFDVSLWLWISMTLCFESKLRFASCSNKVEVPPTGLDDDRHGSLLYNGSYSREGGGAAVVSPTVFLNRMGEVEVSIQTRGHPLVLFYMLEIWVHKHDMSSPSQLSLRTAWILTRALACIWIS